MSGCLGVLKNLVVGEWSMSGHPRCQSLSVSFNSSSKIQFVAMLAALLCLFALCPTALHAQAASSTTVAAVVSDSSGAIVADPPLKLTENPTNAPPTPHTHHPTPYFSP